MFTEVMAQVYYPEVSLPESTQTAINNILERTGFVINQENGQRRMGYPSSWDGTPPPKGCEIFVGKLPRNIFEDELFLTFEKVGEIFEIRLMMNYDGKNRGYAFVTFFNPEDAKTAIKKWNNYEIRKGHFVGVCKSVDNCRLFIGGIPRNKKKDEILGEMKKLTEGVVDVIVYSHVEDKSKNRGFAFVEFENHKAAAIARRKLMNGKFQMWNHDIAVDWAEPEREVDEEIMSKVTVIYARNFMVVTDEEKIKQAFSLNGELQVERVKKLKDYAFIHYHSREDADNALQNMNGTIIDGAVIEVRWAKPPDERNRQRNKGNMDTAAGNPVPTFYFQQPNSQPVVYLPGYAPPVPYVSRVHPPPPPIRMPSRGRGRGAAGIRPSRGGVTGYTGYATGRGAAGMKRNVESRFVPMSGMIHDLEIYPTNPVTFRPTRSPQQVLNDICEQRGWGTATIDAVPSSFHEHGRNVQYWTGKVSIPNLPSQYNLNQSTRAYPDPNQAKQAAAEYFLSQLGVAYERFDQQPSHSVVPIPPSSGPGVLHAPPPSFSYQHGPVGVITQPSYAWCVADGRVYDQTYYDASGQDHQNWFG
ncbi:probable RNA-binding protein 46 isoform X2 [Limulus polyphemus]|uniref:Probable RNA-binding protein 46 isoform X2 n=1 Tax=Limulus polyphemus TaxID=6850 RepID=A0ABM1SK08_LIMPO|nr:probable RNA-binding protein 46 isoform X2 [Limulus polyphemus]